jgi:uncharacterized protein YkwD
VSGDPTIVRTRNAARRSFAVFIAIVCLVGAGTVGATSNDSYVGSLPGSASGHPVVGIAATRSGKGYWLAAADGGVFTFGDAQFHGSTGGRALTAPIVGIAPTPSGDGYWLAGADGAVFPFGDAAAHGASGARPLSAPVVGIAPTRSAYGYWLVMANGTTLSSGHARAFRTRFPSLGTSTLAATGNTAAAIAAAPAGGYFIASIGGAVGVSAKLPPPAPAPPAPPAPVPPPPAPRPASASASASQRPAAAAPHTAPLIALQLMLRMNAERAARDLAPLGWDPLLASRARAWANTLLATDAFHHQNLQMIANVARGRFEELGENIFAGGGSAADAGAAHVGFMRSADHRANMLMPQGQLVGIGAACLQGKLVVVEDFAIRMGAPMPPNGQPVPPMNPIVAPKTNGASC